MPKFTFQFESLLGYRRKQRDVCRQLVAKFLTAQRELAEQQRDLVGRRSRLYAELRNLSRPGCVDARRCSSRRLYAGRLLKELQLIEQKQELATKQLHLARQVLTSADQKVHVLEKLKERQRSEFSYWQARRAGIEAEEEWRSFQLSDFR